MAYNNNIPQPSDLLSQSQSDILNNFSAIFTLVGVNHVNFGSADQGKHKWVTLPSQAATPPAGSGFAPTELGVYNAVYATSAQQELFINKTNQATVVQVPSTASILSANSNPAAYPNPITGGYTVLPSGVILKFGGIPVAVTGQSAIAVGGGNSTNGPVFNGIMTVLLTPWAVNAGDVNFAVRLVSIDSPTQFTVYVSSRTNVGPATGFFTYLIIGY